MVEEVVDPAGGRGRRPTDRQPLVDGLHGSCGRVVQVEVVALAAGPEDLDVRLVPDLEAPADDLVEAVARDEVPNEGLHQVRPAIQVSWRRDEPDVVEDARFRIGGEGLRHERQLHERPQARRQEAIDDEVDLVEVVPRGAVLVLAIHAEDVVEDGVRPDHLDAELFADDAERQREVLAHGQPARSLAAQEQREVLGADHRPPRPLDRAGGARGIDHDAHLALALGRGRA